jgi:hypothetical protein
MDLIQKLTCDACSGGVRLKNGFITLCARHAPLRPQRDPPEMSHTVDDLRACSFSEIRRPSLFPLATGHFSRLPVQVSHLYRTPWVGLLRLTAVFQPKIQRHLMILWIRAGPPLIIIAPLFTVRSISQPTREILNITRSWPLTIFLCC